MKLFNKIKNDCHIVYCILGIKIKVKQNFNRILWQLKKYKREGYDTLYIPVSGIGDGVIFTAVAKAIYNKTGKKVLVSHKNNELFINNPYIQTIDYIFDSVLDKKKEKQINKLGINIIYPTYWKFTEVENRYFLVFPEQHIIAETAANTGYTGEIELRPELFLTEEEKAFGRFSKDKKQIAIMSTSLDRHKQWDKWQELVDNLKDKYYIIQIGGPDDIALDGVVDVRGKYTLRECASILYNSDLFVGSIGGLMHISRAVNCPAVIAYTSAEPDYFCNYICNENVMANNVCNECTKDKVIAYSTVCNKNYECVNSISVNDMLNAIEYKINQKKDSLPFEKVNIVNSNNIGTTSYYKRYSNKLKIV